MSALRTVFVAAALSIGMAGVAHARDISTARLDAPSQQNRVIAEQTLWNCSGDTCTARPNRAPSVRSCRQFVRQSGARIVAFGTETRQLSADELARCNGDDATLQAQN